MKFVLKRKWVAELRGKGEREALRERGDDENRQGQGAGGRWERWVARKDETWSWYGEEGSRQGEVQYLRGLEEGEV